ncbi:MAG: hypothetical protein FWB95_08845 [Treponema sp.]|nr:hypothetical protein [Treponema sp.]
MKNLMKLIGIITLTVIIGFSFAACGGEDEKDGKGGKITVNVKASNNGGTQPTASIASARAIITAAGDTDFTEIKSWYAEMGSPKGSLTPTKFMMGYDVGVYTTTGEFLMIGSGMLDFAKPVPVSVNIGDIPDEFISGLTVAGFSFEMNATVVAFGQPLVEIEWPYWIGTDNQAGRQAAISDNYNVSDYTYDGINYVLVPAVWSGNKASIISDKFEPWRYEAPRISQIVFDQGLRRAVAVDDQYKIIVPFTPSSGNLSSASSITLNISMDLTGMIEVYGSKEFGEIEDVYDDLSDTIFILKDGWWNKVFLTMTIN